MTYYNYNMTPTIINCKKANPVKSNYKDLEDWLLDTNHLYIGRDMSYYVLGAIGSK